MNSCPACNAQDIQLFMTGIYDSNTTKVMECSHCGLQFLDPLMSEQEEADYYKGYYRKQTNRHFREMDLNDLQQRALNHYDQYRAIYLELISDCNSILEIGSGTGGFLKFVRQNSPGTRLMAIERCQENVAFIKHCFGNEVTVVDNLMKLQGAQFDCIVALGVFEHVRDSKRFLVNLRQHLSDNGSLILKVPNKKHPLVYAYNLEEFRKFTYMKQHYYTFTEESFNFLAQKSSFSVDKFEYLVAWGLDNHFSWLRYRKPRDFSDITSILSQETIAAYNSNLISNKMTDIMIAVLIKKQEEIIL